MTENGVNEHCLADAEMPDCGKRKIKSQKVQMPFMVEKMSDGEVYIQNRPVYNR